MKPRFDPRRGCVWSGTPPGVPSECGPTTSSGTVSTPSWSLGSLAWRPNAGRFDQGIDGIRCLSESVPEDGRTERGGIPGATPCCCRVRMLALLVCSRAPGCVPPKGAQLVRSSGTIEKLTPCRAPLHTRPMLHKLRQTSTVALRHAWRSERPGRERLLWGRRVWGRETLRSKSSYNRLLRASKPPAHMDVCVSL